MKKKQYFWRFVFVGVAAVSLNANAQQPMTVFPAKSQTAEQMSYDTSDCHNIAVRQSGYNPGGGQANSGSVGAEKIRGGARGAATGAIIGAIAGDAGKGAAIGATAGGLKRGFGQVDKNASGGGSAQGQSNYNTVYSSCLMSRGYDIR